MIAGLYHWVFPQSNHQRAWYTEIPTISKSNEIDAVVQRLRESDLFTSEDTFGCADDIRTSLRGDRIRIQYAVKNTGRIFVNNPAENYAHFQFPDGRIGLVSKQFLIDQVRCVDQVRVQLKPKLNVTIEISEPRLDINDEAVHWHGQNAQNSTAADLLMKLRDVSNDNMRVFTCLTQLLTQTPLNDMFKVVAAYLHEKYSVIVMNGSNQIRDNILSDPRFRGYKIKTALNAKGEQQVKVTAIIAGYFSACAIKNSLELVHRKANKDIGWYRCAVTYNLTSMAAFADFQIIAYPENWNHSEFHEEEVHEQAPLSPLNADLEEAASL